MAIDSKFLVLTKEALKDKVSNLNSSWTTILINGDLAYSKGADAGLANNLCVNADLLKEIITGNLRYEAKAEDNFLLAGDYYTLKNINGVNVPYALKLVLDFIALLKKPYTVEFRDGSTVLYTLTIYWNSKVTKPADPTKSGYTFTGWTPSWNFNTDTLTNKNQLDSSGKLIFTALWEASNPYYISFSQGNEVTNEDFKDIMGEIDTTGYLLELDLPSQTTTSITKYLSSSTASFNITNLTIGRNTYTIANLPSLYYITVNGTRIYSNSLPIIVNSGNIDIVFHLNVGYTLTYYRNYPTGDTSTSLSYDASGNTSVKTLSNIGFTTPSGYYFVEWNTNANGTGTSYNPGNTISVSANTSLYAIWEEESATISYLTLTCNCTSIQEGNTCTFTAPKYHWSDGTETTATGVSWSSSNTSIATISNGVVTAVSAGTATITASADGYSDYCDITITAAPIEEEHYYYRFINNSNKTIDIYLDSLATWHNSISRNGTVNTGAMSDDNYMLFIDAAPTSGYHWEIDGPEGYYKYDDTYGMTVYGNTDSSDPATYTIFMVEDDAPSVEVTCIEYNVTIIAQDVAATATTANYSVTATKITHYNNGTSSTQTIPASGYTVTGASFNANTDTTPKTKTISVSINNPDSNLCSGSVTTASDTFTLAAADEEPPTPTCSTYTYYITNNGATTLNVSGDINGDILAGETGTFTSSNSSITYSLLWSGSCKAEFSTLQDHYSYHGGSGTITLTYHEYRAPVISSGNTLTAGDYPDCSASITHTPEYTVVNNPTVNATNIALTLTASLNSSISNNEIIDGYREYSYIITENSSTDPKDYSVESLGLNCSDEKSGTLGGAPDFVYGVIEIIIDSECNGGIPGMSKQTISSEYIKTDNNDANSIYVAGNIAENLNVSILYYEGCGDGGEETTLMLKWYDDNGSHESPAGGTITVVKNGYNVVINTISTPRPI